MIYSRDHAAKADLASARIFKMPDAVSIKLDTHCSFAKANKPEIMIGNGMSDWTLNWRYWIQGNCYDNPKFERTGSDLAVDYVNRCLYLS